MKVRQFLTKFLYASSTTSCVFVVLGGKETRLVGIIADPKATNPLFERELNATLVSFRITDKDLTIYAK